MWKTWNNKIPPVREVFYNLSMNNNFLRNFISAFGGVTSPISNGLNSEPLKTAEPASTKSKESTSTSVKEDTAKTNEKNANDWVNQQSRTLNSDISSYRKGLPENSSYNMSLPQNAMNQYEGYSSEDNYAKIRRNTNEHSMKYTGSNVSENEASDILKNSGNVRRLVTDTYAFAKAKGATDDEAQSLVNDTIDQYYSLKNKTVSETNSDNQEVAAKNPDAEAAAAGSIEGNSNENNSDEDEYVEFTVKPGDTFGQMLVDAGLVTDNGLWGPNGDVAYYSQQLNDQNGMNLIYPGQVIRFKKRK